MGNIISSIEDRTENGNPNYSIELIAGRRCYLSGVILNPMPLAGQARNVEVKKKKTTHKTKNKPNKNMVTIENQLRSG